MRLVFCLLAAWAVSALGAPPLTPMPWRYGVVYWVGEVPPYPSAMINVITHKVERALGWMNLVPYPKPDEGWARPLEIHASDRAEAKALLPPDFSAALVPGPQPETFWALHPLRYQEREIPPLVVAIFPDVGFLQDALGHYGAVGVLSIPHPAKQPLLRLLWEEWLDALVPEDVPLLALPLRSDPIPLPIHFEAVLAHEAVHWATWIWCLVQGLNLKDLSLLLVEGLAEYAALVWNLGSFGERMPTAQLHPVAAYWAQNQGLKDFPEGLAGALGASLLDFLARKHGWSRLLVLLPGFIARWNAYLEEWEPEWKAWFKGPVVDLKAVVELAEQDLFLCANLLSPLFGRLWDLVLEVGTTRDTERFWRHLDSPWPPATPELWQAMHRRERQFLYIALLHKDEGKRAKAQALLQELRGLREGGDWEGYVGAFIRGVKGLIAGLPVLERVLLP